MLKIDAMRGSFEPKPKARYFIIERARSKIIRARGGNSFKNARTSKPQPCYCNFKLYITGF